MMDWDWNEMDDDFGLAGSLHANTIRTGMNYLSSTGNLDWKKGIFQTHRILQTYHIQIPVRIYRIFELLGEVFATELPPKGVLRWRRNTLRYRVSGTRHGNPSQANVPRPSSEVTVLALLIHSWILSTGESNGAASISIVASEHFAMRVRSLALISSDVT